MVSCDRPALLPEGLSQESQGCLGGDWNCFDGKLHVIWANGPVPQPTGPLLPRPPHRWPAGSCRLLWSYLEPRSTSCTLPVTSGPSCDWACLRPASWQQAGGHSGAAGGLGQLQETERKQPGCFGVPCVRGFDRPLR